MPEFRVWVVAGTCVLLVAIVASFGGRKKFIDSIVTVVATFLGVFAGLAVNSAHDRAVREGKANNTIEATLVGIHESVRPYAQLLDSSRALGLIKSDNKGVLDPNGEAVKSLEDQFISTLQKIPVGTPTVMSNILSSPEAVEFIDELTLYTVVDDTVKMNFASNEVNNSKTNAQSAYNSLREFTDTAANAYEILCIRLRRNEGKLDDETWTRLQSNKMSKDDLSKANCEPQWTEADLVNKLRTQAGNKLHSD